MTLDRGFGACVPSCLDLGQDNKGNKVRRSQVQESLGLRFRKQHTRMLAKEHTNKSHADTRVEMRMFDTLSEKGTTYARNDVLCVVYECARGQQLH